MATYQSTRVSSSLMTRTGIHVNIVKATFSVTSNLATSDVIEMVNVPAGAVIHDVKVAASASLGTTSTATVGDGSDTDRFITSGTFGQGAASMSSLNAATGVGYAYTANDTIDITMASVATAATGATITMTVLYTMQDV